MPRSLSFCNTSLCHTVSKALRISKKAIKALSPSSRVLKIDSCKLNATVLLPICFRYPCCIGVGRFRILGGQGLEYWEGGQVGGGANFQQAHDVDAT